MKVSDLIAELEYVKMNIGDIPVQLQDDSPAGPGQVTDYPSLFVVPEEYENGWVCNIRWWPY